MRASVPRERHVACGARPGNCADDGGESSCRDVVSYRLISSTVAHFLSVSYYVFLVFLLCIGIYFPFVFSNPETFFGPRNHTGYTALLHPDLDHGLGNVDSVEEAAEQLDHLLTIEKVRGGRG